MKSQVVLLKCSKYDREKIYEELVWGIGQLGGVQQFVQPEEKILLKPNLLRKAEADSAIVTHPLVVAAVAGIFKKAGCEHLSYGDSAGVGSMEKIAEACGLAAEMERLNIPMADFSESILVNYPQGKMAKQFHMAKAVVETEALINICKMKTHQLERMTGAVKNMYGCIQSYKIFQCGKLCPDAGGFKSLCPAAPLYYGWHYSDGGQRPSFGNPSAYGGHAFVHRSSGAGQCLLFPDESGTGAGADKCSGRENGPWCLGG